MENGKFVEIPGIPTSSLTERQKQMLSMTDEEWHLHTWEDLKSFISTNSLEKLNRTPSQLRGYLAWSRSAEIKQEYGDMTNYVLKKRVYWDPLPISESPGPPTFAYENATPFASRSDYRILVNTWPYGFVPGIVHICVWLKVRLPTDDVHGDLTPEGRKLVVDFVEETFVKGLGVEGQDKVLWFKNWARLQSVRGLEHIHVLVRDVDRERLDGILEWPGGKHAY